MRSSPASATKRLPRARPTSVRFALRASSTPQAVKPERETRIGMPMRTVLMTISEVRRAAGGVENLVVGGDAVLEHPSRDLVDGVVASDVLHVHERSVLVREHAAVDRAGFEIERGRGVDLVREAIKPRGAQLRLGQRDVF